MSFLNRLMASIGIGSATVDTIVESAQVRVGDTLRGVIQVRGG
jgi:sporulation-control protein